MVQTVNALDLAFLLGDWGPCLRWQTDLVNDATVNSADWAVQIASWGHCP